MSWFLNFFSMVLVGMWRRFGRENVFSFNWFDAIVFWGRTLQHIRLRIFSVCSCFGSISCSPLSCFCCDMGDSSAPPVEDNDISVPVPIHPNWKRRADAIARKYNSAEYVLLKLYALSSPPQSAQIAWYINRMAWVIFFLLAAAGKYRKKLTGTALSLYSSGHHP